MNLIEDIQSIIDKDIKVKWNRSVNLALFEYALEVAQSIKKLDILSVLNMGKYSQMKATELIKRNLKMLSESYGLKVIEKRETNGTWRG